MRNRANRGAKFIVTAEKVISGNKVVVLNTFETPPLRYRETFTHLSAFFFKKTNIRWSESAQAARHIC